MKLFPFSPKKRSEGFIHDTPPDPEKKLIAAIRSGSPLPLDHNLKKYAWPTLKVGFSLFTILCIIVPFIKDDEIVRVFSILMLVCWGASCWMTLEISKKQWITVLVPIITGILCLIISFRVLSFKNMAKIVVDKGILIIDTKFQTTEKINLDSLIKAKVDSIALRYIDSLKKKID